MAASAKAFHLQPEAVDLVLSGLVQHVLVALPQNLTQAAGIRPNVSDRFGPKCLWVGRMRHLCLLLRSEGLRKATDPRFIRDSLRQQAQQCQSSPVSGKGELIKLLVHLIELPSKKLEALARGVVAVQKFFRHRRSRMRRRKETAEEMDLAAMQLLQTAFQNVPTKGYVIYLCGSTGIVGDSFRYLRMMAGMGYVVLAPDMMVSAAVKGSTLRTRQPKACMLLDSAASDYWSKTSLYADNSACAGEMVYSSKADSFMSNPEDFNRMYSNIITLRQAELAHVLRLLPLSMRRLGVTLIGSSEGAVVLSSFQDEPFADIINGRVILAYPCEPNYWTYFRPEDAGIAGDAAIPTLNLVGCDDQYFGRRDSVAAMVAQMSGLPPVRGHALEAMAERGCTHGLVCHFEGAVHTLLKTHDSVVREVLADFLQRPQLTCRNLPVQWERVPHLRSHIRRFRRHASSACHVVYVRFCAPRNRPEGEVEDPHKELLERIDRVIYAAGIDKGAAKKPELSMEQSLASIISAAHTSQDCRSVHTALQLTQKQPDFVEKVEEQLESLLQEEHKAAPPRAPGDAPPPPDNEAAPSPSKPAAAAPTPAAAPPPAAAGDPDWLTGDRANRAQFIRRQAEWAQRQLQCHGAAKLPWADGEHLRHRSWDSPARERPADAEYFQSCAPACAAGPVIAGDGAPASGIPQGTGCGPQGRFCPKPREPAVGLDRSSAESLAASIRSHGRDVRDGAIYIAGAAVLCTLVLALGRGFAR